MLKITFFILMILLNDSAVLLKGEIRCWSLLGFKQLRGMNLDWPCLVNNDLKLASLFVIACGEANVTRHCPVSRITFNYPWINLLNIWIKPETLTNDQNKIGITVEAQRYPRLPSARSYKMAKKGKNSEHMESCIHCILQLVRPSLSWHKWLGAPLVLCD